MARDPIPTWFFALAVVRRGDRFVLVHERKHGQLWYLPGGRAEPGEALVDAARRETLEEAGIHIVPEALIRVEHSPRADGGARCRAIFLARPADDTPLKSAPDEESLGAAWVSLEDLDDCPLRNDEVAQLIRYVAAGEHVQPLSALTHELAPLTPETGVALPSDGTESGYAPVSFEEVTALLRSMLGLDAVLVVQPQAAVAPLLQTSGTLGVRDELGGPHDSDQVFLVGGDHLHLSRRDLLSASRWRVGRHWEFRLVLASVVVTLSDPDL
ncbi:MAG: NUDIX domain-containing protein [Solirubrobacterales bacterium]|nr:NUDIX domain-containing protein [Solirubrobacterales bacterium]MCO5328402.1 NUDIX domain-containing protein [Solirubrobacterales bacterium]